MSMLNLGKSTLKARHIVILVVLLGISILVLSCFHPLPIVYADSPVTITTSSISNPTSTAWQRKIFYTLGRFWNFRSNGSGFVFDSSTDGVTWSASNEIVACTDPEAISVYSNGTHVVYSRWSSAEKTTYFRQGTFYASGAILWNQAEQTIVTNDTYQFGYCNIAIDNQGYAWVCGSWYAGTVYLTQVYKNSKKNGIWTTSAGFPYTLDDSKYNDASASIIVPLTSSGQVTVIYLSSQSSTAAVLEARRWTGAAWTDGINSTHFTRRDVRYGSVDATGQNDTVHVVYVAVNSSGGAAANKLYYEQFSADAWSGFTSIVGIADFSASIPKCMYDYNNSTLYTFYCSKTTSGNITANHIYYRTCVSGIWVDQVDWIDESADVLTHAGYMNSLWVQGQNSTQYWAAITYVTKTSDPYNVRFAQLFGNLPSPPTIGVATTAWNDTDNCYAQKNYTIQVTYSDATNFYDIRYCEMFIKTGANATRAEFAYLEDTSTFSTVSGSASWEMAGSNSSSGNDITITWDIRAHWAATEESDLDLLFFANDTGGYSGNSLSDENFDVVTSLVTSNFATNDSHTDINGGVTLTGTVYYANDPASTTSSTSYPPDAEFSFVHIHDAAHNSVGSTGVITNGAFSVSFNIANVVQLNVYHVYLNMADGDYPDADAIDGDTIAVIGDRIIIDTLGTSDTRANIGENVTIYATASLEYGPHTLGAGDSLTLGGEVMTWDPVDSRFEANITFLVVGDQTINSFTSGTEATFVITVGNINAKTETTIWDALMIFNVQPVQYQGSGAFYYQAQIEWVWDSVLISGATGGVAYPNDTAIGSMTSNSTGWLTFIINQGNATSGNFIIYGINDNNYTITVSGSNKTFTLNGWELVSQDVDGNTLTGSTIVLTLSGTSIWSGSPRTLYVPSDTFNVSISWLQNLVINTTNNLVLAGDTTTNFNCSCYPFTVSATTYWASSNATIATKTYVSDLLVLTFSGGASPYTLVSSCPTQPTFILNVTYDLLTVFDPYGYLVLPHYGNITLSISYESWSDTYVQSTDRIIISSNLTGYKLYVTMTGTSGDMGILKIYCGLRGNPATTSGFVTTSYMGSTLTGNYVFASDATLGLDWTSYGTPGGTSGGSSSSPAGLVASIVFGFPSMTSQGVELNGKLNITWTGLATIYLWDVRCDSPYGDWKIGMPSGLPFTLNMVNSLGQVSLDVVLFIPKNATIGSLLIPCTVVLSTSQGSTKTMRTVVSLDLAAPTVNIPNTLTILFLIPLGLVVFFAIFRKNQRRKRGY